MFATGAIIYLATAWMSYSDPIKASTFYYPLGIFLSVIANAAWLTIAKIVPNRDDILIYGAFWDTIILGAFTLVPLLFFDVRLTQKDTIGFCLIILGILVIKFFK